LRTSVIKTYVLLTSGCVLLASLVHLVHHYVLLSDAYVQAIVAGR
jgi:hypothetical protein